LITIFLAIAGAISKLYHSMAKLDARVSILWDMFKADTLMNIGKRGVMLRLSEWQLSEGGRELISPELKNEIEWLIRRHQGIRGYFYRKKLNPAKLRPWDIIEKLGGVARLSHEAERMNVSLYELVVILEHYIKECSRGPREDTIGSLGRCTSTARRFCTSRLSRQGNYIMEVIRVVSTQLPENYRALFDFLEDNLALDDLAPNSTHVIIIALETDEYGRIKHIEVRDISELEVNELKEL